MDEFERMVLLRQYNFNLALTLATIIIASVGILQIMKDYTQLKIEPLV